MTVSPSIRLSLVLASSLAFGLAPRIASAAGETRGSAPASQTNVAQLNEEGAALYSARDYRHAIEKFIQAYAIDSDPNLLFNIARCYEELGDVDSAIEKYETFLKTPGADTRGRQRARESLAALRQSREQSRHPAAQPQTQSAATPTSSSSAASSEDKHEPSVLPWVVLGGGIASAVVGTTFYMLGVSDHHKVTSAPGYGDPTAVSSMSRQQAQDLVDSGDTKKLVGGIGLGLAGALAATYVVILVSSDHPSHAEQPSLALGVGPGAVSLRGSF
jgi:hypothetical protein